MPRTSKADAAVSLDEPEIEGRYAELGEYTVAFETHKADMDPAALFQGLPGDRCPCPHWGYVIAGSMTFRFSEGDEVYESGDAFYARPGHVPVQNQPGTEILMFSPADELRATEAVMMKNMQAMQPS